MLIILKAATLYGVTPILVPFNNTVHVIAGIVKNTNTDCIIAAAGSLPLDGLLQLYPGLKHVIWVAERSSRHMEWNEVPEGVGGKVEIIVWHEIVEEKRNSALAELPSASSESPSPNVITVSISATDPEKHETVEFTQKVGSAISWMDYVIA